MRPQMTAAGKSKTTKKNSSELLLNGDVGAPDWAQRHRYSDLLTDLIIKLSTFPKCPRCCTSASSFLPSQPYFQCWCHFRSIGSLELYSKSHMWRKWLSFNMVRPVCEMMELSWEKSAWSDGVWKGLVGRIRLLSSTCLFGCKNKVITPPSTLQVSPRSLWGIGSCCYCGKPKPWIAMNTTQTPSVMLITHLSS